MEKMRRLYRFSPASTMGVLAMIWRSRVQLLTSLPQKRTDKFHQQQKIKDERKTESRACMYIFVLVYGENK